MLTAISLFLLIPCAAFSQTYTISTFAGGGLPVNVPATATSTDVVNGLAVDSMGNVYMASRYIVLRLDAKTGFLTLVAGNGTFGFSGDNGPAVSAQLSIIVGVAVDSSGNLYIADTGKRIRKVSNGLISTVAGNGTAGFSGDGGPAISAQLNSPTGVAVDAAGDLYIADSSNQRIRKVSKGLISTITGTGFQSTPLTGSFSGDDGPATNAGLNFPAGVAVDSRGNIFIADTGNHRIRKVSDGIINTLANVERPALNSLPSTPWETCFLPKPCP